MQYRCRFSRRYPSVVMSASILIAALLSVASGAGSAAAVQSEDVLSLTLSPSTIAGGSGGVATGMVTLTVPAPPGGAVVNLTSSNIELAALLPRVTVPEGETSTTFAVGTNAGYRPYSGLSVTVTISATRFTTRSATLTVTAQPRPADFNSGSTAGANTQWDGLMCGGIAPIGGYPGILYSCSPADATGFGTCTFQQECPIGCRRVPPNGQTFNDFCATSGPNPVALSNNFVVSGDRVPAAIVAEAPAGQAQDREQGSPGIIDPHFNASDFPHESIGFPDGATSVPFDVATSYVPTIEFVNVVGFWFNASIPPLLITNGRAGQAWLVMTPPDPAPATRIRTLGDFKITGLNPIDGGQSTFGQIDLSGLSSNAGPTITLTSSHPDIVPSTSIETPASERFFGFQVPISTNVPSADTDVTITASDGRYSFSGVLTVRVPPPPPVLADITVNPTSVVGGNSATGTVVLSAPQSGPTVVQVSIIDSAPASLPTNDPPCPSSSRCHNVTVPAGATSASFTITTSPVTSQFNLNVFAHLSGSPGQGALLLITPGGSTTAKALTISPDSVTGGASATGTVTLTGAAPAGGAVVSLTKALANGGTGTVPVTIPASVTVPAGQTNATFTITTSSVTATTVVRISAAYNGVTVNADMSLFTVLAQVSFSGNVPGGSPTTGTVTFSAPAPSGGALVTLSSANPSIASVPPSVTVPAGQTSATFTANTAPVSSTTGVSISASHDGVTVSTTLFLVVSRAVSSVTLNPSTVVGGTSSTGTVTLRNASSGNVVVALASSNSVFAVVPNSVIVPAGQTSATFPVNTAQVTAPTTVVISASHEDVTKSATLTINPSGSTTATLSAVSLNPTSVIGGNTSTGTVTLSAAAPSGGFAVSLTDNSTAASTPSSVMVAAGATSATFSVNTVSVTTTTIATVTATAGSTSRTANLTITAGGGGGGTAFVSPTANAPDSGGDGNGFQSNPVNAHIADAAVATDANSGTGTSTSCTNSRKDRHRFYDFGFTIANGSAIAGIEVRLDARTDSTSGSPRMCVQLSWDGGATWTAAKATGTLGTSLATFTLGGAADTWGRTWSATDFTNPNFRLRVINVAGSTSRDFFLDWVAVRPYVGTIGPAALSAVSVSPTSVTGGNASTGTVTLTAAAPSGGAVVSLSSSNTGVVSVPASVTIAAGATSATFTTATSAVSASTPVTITAAYASVTKTATLTVNPPSQTATLTVTASGRSGERVMSSPAGINVSVGSTGSASFPTGTSITLSVSDGRDAIWSGACSSGGDKTKTCTFTMSGNASVTANVQ